MVSFSVNTPCYTVEPVVFTVTNNCNGVNFKVCYHFNAVTCYSNLVCSRIECYSNITSCFYIESYIVICTVKTDPLLLVACVCNNLELIAFTCRNSRECLCEYAAVSCHNIFRSCSRCTNPFIACKICCTGNYICSIGSRSCCRLYCCRLCYCCRLYCCRLY